MYRSFFKMRFMNSLQYRAAAYAGIATQFAWGFMLILMYNAFYQTGADQFPMTLSELSSYIWLQQASIALFMVWFMENEIFTSITSGNVAYELCRPVSIYNMWFVRSMAVRLSKTLLRCIPILLISTFLPEPFNLTLPVDFWSFILFVVSLVIAVLLMVSIGMLIYISAFYTVSPMGIRILSVSLVEFLSGGIIPIPFLPNEIRKVFELLPFASLQNTPFLIYNGHISGNDAYLKILIQLFWLSIIFITGKITINKALKRVVVQGG